VLQGPDRNRLASITRIWRQLSTAALAKFEGLVAAGADTSPGAQQRKGRRICKTKPILRKIEANRRNSLKSTGPKTAEGKNTSRCNAVRHGLTAETVIGALEDAEDYKAFEATITADYDAQSAVERELVLRLASVLWRLRRATTMETGLFEIQAEHLRCSATRSIAAAIGRRMASQTERKSCPAPGGEPVNPAADLARCFCVWPICPAAPSTGSAGMKQSFGVKPARSCLRSMHWIDGNYRTDGAVSVSAVGKSCRPTIAKIINSERARPPNSCDLQPKAAG
jgi:hypothetical protein